MIHAASPDDVDDLARIHVQAWRETYPGLLPEAEIARRDLAYRQTQWAKMVENPALTTLYASGQGFVQFGPQREAEFAATYPQELYSFYVLEAHQGTGLGRALLQAAMPDCSFTALMVAGNRRADRFYRAAGGVVLDEREVTEGDLTFLEIAFGFHPPFAFYASATHH